MNSQPPGAPISDVEVTNVSADGVQLRVGDQVLFASFDDFPWFRDATIADITRVDLPCPGHLYWPALDVDLAVDSLINPAAYPLVSRSRSKARVAEGPSE